MITITTWNMKGGTGKTTTTFNLATNYARAGKKGAVYRFRHPGKSYSIL